MANKYLKQAFAALAAVALLVACSDDKVEAGPGTPSQPSAVDNKPLPAEEWTDDSYAPGDNFYMYSIGKYWREAQVGDGGSVFQHFAAIKEMEEYILCQEVEDLQLSVTMANPDEPGDTEEGADNTPTAALIDSWRAEIDQAATLPELYRVAARQMLRGALTPFTINLNRKGDKLLAFFQPNIHIVVNSQTGEKLLPIYLGVTAAMEGNELPEEIVKGYDAKAEDKPAAARSAVFNPIPQDELHSLSATRGADAAAEMIATMARELGVEQHVVLPEEMKPVYQTLAGLDTETFRTLLRACNTGDKVIQDAATRQKYIQQLAGVDLQAATKMAEKGGHAFTINYIDNISRPLLGQRFIDNFKKNAPYDLAAKRAKLLEMAEEIRTAMRNRIEGLEWMSAPTRQKAQEKLDAIVFEAVYPVSWPQAWEQKVEISDTDVPANIVALRKYQLGCILSLVGGNAYDNFFFICMLEAVMYDFNSFYAAQFNKAMLLPCLATSGMLNDEMNEAAAYASFMVIAHELCHAFDAQGAQYDKKGDKHNWWTVNDRMEFAQRQQKLIDCYSNLEIMPDELPLVMGDGKKTLDENIADLGGVLLCFDAYNARLLRNGFHGDELKKQQRRFFQSYAYLWAGRYTADFAKYQLASDEHSLMKERVNGVVMNIDSWYDLFGVTSENNLYLAPDRRARIW